MMLMESTLLQPGDVLERLRMLALLCLVWVLPACSPRAEAPLRVATHVWPAYESLYLARSLGRYHGAPIRLVEMTSAREVARREELRGVGVENGAAGARMLDAALQAARRLQDARLAAGLLDHAVEASRLADPAYLPERP